MMRVRETDSAGSSKRTVSKRQRTDVPSLKAKDEVPLQVRVPRGIRRQVGILCVERGESLRTLILQGLRSVGVDVPDGELVDRRGRRRE